MPSHIDVKPLSERVHVRLKLAKIGADLSVELASADARILARRLAVAADEADRPPSISALVESCR